MKITLEETPSTGYIWQSEPSLPYAFYPANKSIGSGGHVVFEFTNDQLPIRFFYKRPWEEGPSIKSFIIMEEENE